MNTSIKNLWIHILAILIFKYLKIQFCRNIIMEYIYYYNIIISLHLNIYKNKKKYSYTLYEF